MYLRSVRPTLMDGVAAAMANTLTARPAGPLLATPTLRLFKTPIAQILPSLLVAAFTEADFTGYTPFTLAAFGGPLRTPPGWWIMNASGLYTAGSPVTVSNTCYGYYVTNDPATLVYAAEIFTDPNTGVQTTAGFASPGDFLELGLILGSPTLLNFGLV